MSNRNVAGDSKESSILLGYTEEEMDDARKKSAEEAVITARKQWESEPCKHNEYFELLKVTTAQNKLLKELGDVIKEQNDKLKKHEMESSSLQEKDSLRSMTSQLVETTKDKILAEQSLKQCKNLVEQLTLHVSKLSEEKIKLQKSSDNNLNSLTKQVSELIAENVDLKKQIRDLRPDNEKQFTKKILDDLNAKNKLVFELKQELESSKKKWHQEAQKQDVEKEELKKKGETTFEKLKRAVDAIKKFQDQSKGLQDQVEILIKEKSALESQIENERKLSLEDRSRKNDSGVLEREKKLSERVEELEAKSKESKNEISLLWSSKASLEKELESMKQESLKIQREWKFSEEENKRLESEVLVLEEKNQTLREELKAQLVKFEVLVQEKLQNGTYFEEEMKKMSANILSLEKNLKCVLFEKEKVQKSAKEEKENFLKQINKVSEELSKATADLVSEKRERQISESNFENIKEELAKEKKKVTARDAETEKLKTSLKEERERSEGVFARLRIGNGEMFLRPEEAEMKRKGPRQLSPGSTSGEKKQRTSTSSENMKVEEGKSKLVVVREKNSGKLRVEVLKNELNSLNSPSEPKGKQRLLGLSTSPRIKFLEGNNFVPTCFHCGSPEHFVANCPYKPFLSRNPSGGGQIEVNFDSEGVQTSTRKFTSALPNQESFKDPSEGIKISQNLLLEAPSRPVDLKPVKATATGKVRGENEANFNGSFRAMESEDKDLEDDIEVDILGDDEPQVQKSTLINASPSCARMRSHERAKSFSLKS